MTIVLNLGEIFANLVWLCIAWLVLLFVGAMLASFWEGLKAECRAAVAQFRSASGRRDIAMLVGGLVVAFGTLPLVAWLVGFGGAAAIILPCGFLALLVAAISIKPYQWLVGRGARKPVAAVASPVIVVAAFAGVLGLIVACFPLFAGATA